MGARSVILGSSATFNTVSNSISGLPTSSNKAEKEEIERLNAVIASQRAIMADLEKAVAGWKTRMKAQAELIQKLVVQNNGSSGGQTPPASDGENEAETAFGSFSSPQRRPTSFGEGFNTLPRTTHLSLSREANAPTLTTNNNEPYYGAHTFNRPPPASGSPQKVSFLTNTFSGTNSPSSPPPRGERRWQSESIQTQTAKDDRNGPKTAQIEP